MLARCSGQQGRHALAMLVLAAGLTAGEPARAQTPSDPPPTAADREQARGLMDLGRKRLAEGRYAEALEAFEGADALMKVPVTSLAVAETLIAQGRLILARDRLLAIARSKPVLQGGVEPVPFTAARERASELARALAVRIPSIRVEVIDDLGYDITSEARIWLGKRELEPAQRGLPQRIDPGKVEVSAQVDGHVVQARTVDVEESEHHVIGLVAVSPTECEEDGADIHPLVWAGVATAAVGGVFGGVFGAAALSKSSSLDGRCVNGQCIGVETQGEIDSMNLFATLSTVGFGVAAAGAVLGTVGVVLMLTDDDSDQETALVVRATGAALRVTF